MAKVPFAGGAEAPILKIRRFLTTRFEQEIEDLCDLERARGDSPIERLFYLALQALLDDQSQGLDLVRAIFRSPEEILHDKNDYRPRAGNRYVTIESQKQIGSFRVDFLLMIMGTDGRLHKLVVECDGHNFHERTKEQASKDRSRDRTLHLNGYTVFRFTGAELWRDPIACAAQVAEWLSNRAYEWLGTTK